MTFRCVKDLRESPVRMCDGPPFSRFWLEPWFLGYPDTEVELDSEIKKREEDSEIGDFYRSLYDKIDTRVEFLDPSLNERRIVPGFLAVLSASDRKPVILFSVQAVSADRVVGYIHAVYEEEN